MNQHANVLNGSKTRVKKYQWNENRANMPVHFASQSIQKKIPCKYKSFPKLIDYLITWV